jgi:hypothetical protein
MSTYQYYEFLALDGPISDDGLRYSEGCSSRAEVSRYRWVNSYNWGDFSGNADQMLKYYDAFFYFADWGSFQCSLVFPEGCLVLDDIEPYLTAGDREFGARLSCSGESDRFILTWEYDEEATCWDDPEEIGGLLGRLSGIREQVMRGDYRALFLVWLANFDPDWMEDEEGVVPPIPPGMNRLSDALRCLAEQLCIEEELLQVAAEFSCGNQAPEPTPIADVIDTLSVAEMKHLLVRVAQGGEGRVKAELIQKTRPDAVVGDVVRVTCAEFAAQVLKIREVRTREQAIKNEERRCKEEQIRRDHLDHVIKQSEAIWQRLDQGLKKKTPSAYDAAVEQLKDLRDAYAQADESKEFMARFSQFRMRYGQRPALLRRVDKL